MKKTLIFFVVSCLFDCFSQHEHLLRDFGAKCFKEFDLQTGHVLPKGGVSELPKKREHVEGVKREFIISGCKILKVSNSAKFIIRQHKIMNLDTYLDVAGQLTYVSCRSIQKTSDEPHT